MATKQEELSLFELAVPNSISDTQRLMVAARDLLKQGLNNARQEESAIEEITKTLNEVHTLRNQDADALKLHEK